MRCSHTRLCHYDLGTLKGTRHAGRFCSSRQVEEHLQVGPVQILKNISDNSDAGNL